MINYKTYLLEASSIDFTKSGKQVRSFDNTGEFAKYLKDRHDVDVTPQQLGLNHITNGSGKVVGYTHREVGGANDHVKHFALVSHSDGYDLPGHFYADLKL